MKIVEAWPVYEFECPKCGEIQQLGEGDFENDRIYDDEGNWRIAEYAETVCKCGEVFIVIHD
jgi:hypothetical protein